MRDDKFPFCRYNPIGLRLPGLESLVLNSNTEAIQEPASQLATVTQKMIEVCHKITGQVLHRVEVSTLKKVRFCELELSGANFRDQRLDDLDFSGVSLEDADFTDASCIKVNFYSAHLRRASLVRTKLWGVDGEGADLREADLTSALLFAATLRHACLSDAKLRGADLKSANLARATLPNTDLNCANLTETIFHRTHLVGANFSGATLCSTIFAECKTLHKAKGLAEIEHTGPSSLDRETLRACAAHLPDAFLLGVGYSADELGPLRAMYPPIAPEHSLLRRHSPTLSQ